MAGRPLNPRIVYDLDIQALLRIQSAVTIDHDIPSETHSKLSEALSYVIRTLRDVSDNRRGVRLVANPNPTRKQVRSKR